MKFDDYTRTIIRFNSGLYDNVHSDRGELFFAVAALLQDLLEHWLAACPGNTGWKIGPCRDFGHIISLLMYNESAGIDLHVGINKDCLYLEMNVTDTENVARMPAELWDRLFALNNFCRLENITEERETGIDLFSVTWPFETYSVAEVFTNGVQVFNTLLALNSCRL